MIGAAISQKNVSGINVNLPRIKDVTQPKSCTQSQVFYYEVDMQRK